MDGTLVVPHAQNKQVQAVKTTKEPEDIDDRMEDELTK
jgi:hypothetical protein